jgi:hypothetical protein
LTTRPLVLGPLRAEGYALYRSSLRWLVPPGSQCRANEVFAYCTISLVADGRRPNGQPLFADETALQVALASRAAGRVFGGQARGGLLSTRSVETWAKDDVVAYLEHDDDSDDGEAMPLRLLLLAGRRVSELANSHAGLLGGWLERSRGWWSDGDEPPLTLLCLGICDATGVVSGMEGAYLEMFEAEARPTQCVYTSEGPLVHTACVLLDQLARTPAQAKAIGGDIQRWLATSNIAPTPEDWIAFGALLAGLERSPIQESYPILTGSGAGLATAADVLLLSLSAEPRAILRHRSLGYYVHLMPYHKHAAGPAFRAWLDSAFEFVSRSVADIRRDYERLIEVVTQTTGARVAIVNRMSTSGDEDVWSYTPFDSPLGDTLTTIAAKELNLMLHDLSETHEVAIIDLDALAAELGGAAHVPDGIHQSGPIQAALRAELRQVLDAARPARRLAPLVT